MKRVCLVAALCALATSLWGQPDVEVCSVPGLSFGGASGTPTDISDTLTVTDDFIVADVQLFVDVSHSFIGDVVMDLTDGNTTVTVHNGLGLDQQDLFLTFNDAGVLNGSEPYDCDCNMQPSGPGLLSDLAGGSSATAWTLNITDQFPTLDDGVLDRWCLSLFETTPVAPPPPIGNLLCISPPGSGVGQFAWTLTNISDEIRVYIDGNLADVIPGNSTTYVTPPQSIPSTIEVCFQAVTGGVNSPKRCCFIAVQDVVDVEGCSTPATTISEVLPAQDIIAITDNNFVGDLQVKVDVTHTFVGDLLVDLISPQGTTIRLHNGDGADQQDLKVTFWDFGLENGSLPYNCECVMQPPGPGSLVDYVGETTQGDWRINIFDQFSGDFGVLNEWCVRAFVNMPVFPVENLSCEMASSPGSVSVSWVHPTDQDSVIIVVNGAIQATLPGPFLAGTVGNYITDPFLGPTEAQICVIPSVAGIEGPQQCCTLDVTVPPVKDLTWDTVAGSGVVDLSWANGTAYSEVNVYLDELLIATLGGNETAFSTAALPIPSSGELCVEGVLPVFGSSEPSCVGFLLLPEVDIEECSLANLPIDDLNTPTVDTLFLTGNELIMDLEVSISLSHTFLGDIDVDLTSPSGTMVRLHDQGGGSSDDLVALFTDSGIPNGTAPFDCGCEMQPAGIAGVGSLADFVQETVGGPWTLTITDNFALDSGTLHRWCVRVPMACTLPPPTNLGCSVASGDVSLNWDNNDSYDLLEVWRDGVVVANLPGTSTTYVDTGVAPGVHEYQILVGQIGLACNSISQPCEVAFGITDVVYRGELLSEVDSTSALIAALEADGKVVLEVDEITLAALQPAESDLDSIWVMLGTFPDNKALTFDEGLLLAELHTGDFGLNNSPDQDAIAVYLESGDFWGFDAPTPFIDYDGVQNGFIFDGDDSLLNLRGQDTGLGLDLSGGVWDAPYTQDQLGTDYNDQLIPATSPPDLGGPSVAVTWTDEARGLGYNTGLYYASSFAPIIVQSWEFGGYGADQLALAALYNDALTGQLNPTIGGDDFLRGDIDQDGQLLINDPILVLGYLFVEGSEVPACFDSADVNDDGSVGIADVISLLGFIFDAPGASAPPAPGPTNCGPDPTGDTLPACVFTGCS